MTPVQEIILRCLFLEPEDKTAFARFQKVAKTRRWNAENPEHYAANVLKSRKKNLDRNREKKRRWRQANPEHQRRLRRVWEQNRRRDRAYRTATNLRRRVYHALGGRVKSARTKELLGCPASELCAHLEKQFRPGMTWENYGPVWHVDHIRPCASFDLMDPAQQRECFHHTNLQPLFAEENLKKGAKYDTGQ